MTNVNCSLHALSTKPSTPNEWVVSTPVGVIFLYFTYEETEAPRGELTQNCNA